MPLRIYEPVPNGQPDCHLEELLPSDVVAALRELQAVGVSIGELAAWLDPSKP
ncbi:hypothetical protein [Fimbriiglobus ruber]|uniref:Uncharacterized protein n=1 Tax=Fimbriiglobus ruber TaxID=1908690 RepID=A0A225D066_9BACT|nr:hypothetical protein [Fimbriiglobus ruber]OWK34981.1 hypothetical protein FRUB_09823 [Fimbriiglobus ruber]